MRYDPFLGKYEILSPWMSVVLVVLVIAVVTVIVVVPLYFVIVFKRSQPVRTLLFSQHAMPQPLQ